MEKEKKQKQKLKRITFSYKGGDDGRPTWNEFFMMAAELMAVRSPSEKLQVGSFIINDDKRVLSTGYNGFISGLPHNSIERNGHEINTVHAEGNAIIYAGKNGVKINGGTLFVTHFPCLDCTKKIIVGGIKKIYYHHDYHNDPVAIDMLKQCNIETIKIDVGVEKE